MLELPKTLRLAMQNEVPDIPSVHARILYPESAKIVEGYKLVEKDPAEAKYRNAPFEFYAEINIDISRLWDLVVELANELPDVTALLFGLDDEEIHYGRYMPKDDLIMDLTEFKNELIQDTFLQWGLIFNNKEKLIEIFVSEYKYVKFWGVDKESFRSRMAKMGIDLKDNINFVDNFPRIREELYLHDDNALMSTDLIEVLKRRYIN